MVQRIVKQLDHVSTNMVKLMNSENKMLRELNNQYQTTIELLYQEVDQLTFQIIKCVEKLDSFDPETAKKFKTYMKTED